DIVKIQILFSDELFATLNVDFTTFQIVGLDTVDSVDCLVCRNCACLGNACCTLRSELVALEANLCAVKIRWSGLNACAVLSACYAPTEAGFMRSPCVLTILYPWHLVKLPLTAKGCSSLWKEVWT
ncbi:MAG: hypothetical protein SPL25_09130, partial [Succinivibrionaceae bacterium]|nr:hypothetical protein [Succinivibrionaceae bacterium]